MSAVTPIEWTDRVWNPVRGCSRVSEGCRNCYAERVAWRFGSKPGQPYHRLVQMTSQGPKWTGKVTKVPSALEEPLSWATPARVFVNSMSDLFHDAVPDEFIDRVFAVMALCQHHTFQVLTKRPQRMLEYFSETWQHAPIELQRKNHEHMAQVAREMGLAYPYPAFVPRTTPYTRWDEVEEALEWIVIPDADRFWTPDGSLKARHAGWPLPNVWLGVSVEDQATADDRIPLLLQTPAAVRFVSAEPVLGPVRLDLLCAPTDRVMLNSLTGKGGTGAISDFNFDRGLDWVIVGGESGHGARPMHPDWARSLRDQCVSAGVPFLFKQWGSWAPGRIHAKRALGSWMTTTGRIEPWAGGAPRDKSEVWTLLYDVGKKAAGRLLDGVQHDGFPEER